VINYAEAIDAKLNPRPLDSGGTPALHFTIKTAMMGQHLENWLLADDIRNGNFAMGLANIELRRGKAQSGIGILPMNTPEHRLEADATTDLEESIFVFAKMPDQIS